MIEPKTAEARQFDENDPLKALRKEFIVPSQQDLKRRALIDNVEQESSIPATYLCGNSLGLQPRRLPELIESHLRAWATKGVLGHFFQHENSSLPPFLHLDEVVAEKMATIVGAKPGEVAVMETLTANLHLLMSSFYQPTKEKYQILIEGKAFPSDHYAVESQIIHHGYDPSQAMVLIEPPDTSKQHIPTSQVLSMIDKHASKTALILLPGIQYYTGQYFDIKTITAYAHSKGILIGWDLAHAVGNVDLQLHEWNVDFAVWCNYKYVNSGPGAIAALFVNDLHGEVGPPNANGIDSFRPRLCGWWGGDKKVRFDMGNRFIPIPGAAGYQVGNPSALALTAVLASLEIFQMTTMTALRTKSIKLTGYLERLLREGNEGFYQIITPTNPAERGAQLSILLQSGLLDGVMVSLEESGIVVDERKPDVIRVAPAPLYNTFEEVCFFVLEFQAACKKAKQHRIIRGAEADSFLEAG